MDCLKQNNLNGVKAGVISFQNKYSLGALLFSFVAIGFSIFSYPPHNLFSYDILGYYLYLPAGLKYNDIALKDLDHLHAIFKSYGVSEGFYQAFAVGNGNNVIKYPLGLAILYSPFYLIGDVFANILKYPRDGFSVPYQLSVLYGCYIYIIIGLVTFRKVLLHFFSDKIAATIIFLLIFGTNYLLQVSIHGQPAMSHGLLFSLHALTIFYTIKWHHSPTAKYVVGLGITIGLTAISRPPEALIVCVPLLYNAYGISSFKQKIGLMMKYKMQILLCVFIVLAITSLQLVYWKVVTGKFIFDSYKDYSNEGFNFLHPYILEFLFSFRKGWLLFTPIMMFFILGFYFLYKQNKKWFFACSIYFILTFYITSSWSCWWYGTSFSSRAIIPAYIVLSICFGYFLQHIWNHKIRIIIAPLFLILVFFNLFQSWQGAHQIIDGSRMTRAYYSSIFLQTTSPTDDQKKLLLIDKYSSSQALQFREKDLSGFNQVCRVVDNYDSILKPNPFIIDSLYYSKEKCCVTNEESPYTLDITRTYKDITKKSYLICKISAMVFTSENPDSLDAQLTFAMFHTYKCYQFKYIDIRDLNLKRGQWNEIHFYVLTTDFWDTRDNIRACFWNKSNKNVFVDDLTFEAYEPLIDETVF